MTNAVGTIAAIGRADGNSPSLPVQHPRRTPSSTTIRSTSSSNSREGRHEVVSDSASHQDNHPPPRTCRFTAAGATANSWQSTASANALSCLSPSQQTSPSPPPSDSLPPPPSATNTVTDRHRFIINKRHLLVTPPPSINTPSRPTWSPPPFLLPRPGNPGPTDRRICTPFTTHSDDPTRDLATPVVKSSSPVLMGSMYHPSDQVSYPSQQQQQHGGAGGGGYEPPQRPLSSSGTSRYPSAAASPSTMSPESAPHGQKRRFADDDDNHGTLSEASGHGFGPHKRFATWSSDTPRPSLPPLTTVTRSPPRDPSQASPPRLGPAPYTAEQKTGNIQWPRVADCLTRVVEASQYLASSASTHLQSRTLPPLESIRAMQHTCYDVQSSLDYLAGNRTSPSRQTSQLQRTPTPPGDSSTLSSFLSHPNSHGQAMRQDSYNQILHSLPPYARPSLRQPGDVGSMLTEPDKLSNSASHGAPQDRPVLPRLRPGSAAEDGSQGSIWERPVVARQSETSLSAESHLSYAPSSVRRRLSVGRRDTGSAGRGPPTTSPTQLSHTSAPPFRSPMPSSQKGYAYGAQYSSAGPELMLHSTSLPGKSPSVNPPRGESRKSSPGGPSEGSEQHTETAEELANKYRKRSRAPAPGACQACGTHDTPEWRRGPDGLRTLCNACGLHYSKVRKRSEAAAKAQQSSASASASASTPGSPDMASVPRQAARTFSAPAPAPQQRQDETGQPTIAKVLLTSTQH